MPSDRDSNARRTLFQRAGYAALRIVARLSCVVLFRFRCSGRENYPLTGGGLLCSNHQSFLDPVLVGLTCDRRLNYLARSTLFRIPVLSALITFLDAIPIERDGLGLSGLKETLRRLKRGEFVLIFPEGTRTQNGEMASIKPGFCSLARRTAVPLIPIGIAGAYESWPRDKRLPRPSKIHIIIGEPLTTNQFEALDDSQLVAELESRMRACHDEASRSRLGHNHCECLRPK